ncbi:MAG: DUF4234 domain-containing protein [Armatimonadota bacterium]
MVTSAGTQMKQCPFCAKQTPAEAVACTHCRASLNAADWAPRAAYSYVQPVWHLVLLSIATFGVYPVYWFYKSWQQVGEYTGKAMSPGWRTVGLFVPILGLVFIYDLLTDVSHMLTAKAMKATVNPGWVLGMLIAGAVCWRLPDPLWLLGQLAVLPLAIVQSDMNRLWGASIPDKPIRSRLSPAEIAVLVLGGILMVLVLLGLALPE